MQTTNEVKDSLFIFLDELDSKKGKDILINVITPIVSTKLFSKIEKVDEWVSEFVITLENGSELCIKNEDIYNVFICDIDEKYNTRSVSLKLENNHDIHFEYQV